MKKIICKKEYDTETATVIKAYHSGEFGDPAGYAEVPYPTEDIVRIAKTKVNAWIDTH